MNVHNSYEIVVTTTVAVLLHRRIQGMFLTFLDAQVLAAIVIYIEGVLFIKAAQALFDMIAGKERHNEIDLLLELFLSNLVLAFPSSLFLQSAPLLSGLVLLGFYLFQTSHIMLLSKLIQELGNLVVV